jgi:hypothetical protein
MQDAADDRLDGAADRFKLHGATTIRQSPRNRRIAGQALVCCLEAF